MTPASTTIRLSRTQVKDADRVGGIELMILWPTELLGPPPALEADRPATRRERGAVDLLIGADCDRHALVPVRVSVTPDVERPPELPPVGGVHLAVILIGARWVKASGAKTGRQCWAAAPDDKGV